MTEKKTKLHVGKDGTPKNCVAKPGKCPLAPPLAHFQKVEQAEAFADKLNELEAEGRTYNGDITNLKDLSDAELVYYQNKIKSEAKDNDNYNLYKSSIKWQKEVRSKSQRLMKEIVEENNKILLEQAKVIDDTAKLRRKWRNETEPEKRQEAYKKYKESLNYLNALHYQNSMTTKANVEDYRKLLSKKDTAEDKFLPLMEKRAKHSGIKKLETNIIAEIDKRTYKFDSEQMREIKAGLEKDLDVSIIEKN